MRNFLRLRGGILVAAALLLGMPEVNAHHSASMFDFSRSLTLDGTVKELRWVNPHVSVLVYGTTEVNAAPTDWLLETTSPSVLVRLGWTRASLKVGDHVRAQVFPLRDDDAHGGLLGTLTMVDSGKRFSTNIGDQERPNLQ